MKNYLIATLIICIQACSAKIDQNSVRASTNIPVAAKVDQVDVAFDSTMPKIFMTIEPVIIRISTGEVDVNGKYSERGTGKDKDMMLEKNRLGVNVKFYREYFLQRQRQITTQLASSLAGVKNFKLMDYEIAKRNEFKAANLAPNDQGLYLVRAVITEANDQVVYKSDKNTVPGFYKDKEVQIQGMVGLDIQVLDPKTGEVVQAFPTQGSYTTKESYVEGGIISEFSKSQEIVKSSIDQALRVALNNAAYELHSKFSGKNTREEEYE